MDDKYVYHRHSILRSIECLWYNSVYVDIRNLNGRRVDAPIAKLLSETRTVSIGWIMAEILCPPLGM